MFYVNCTWQSSSNTDEYSIGCLTSSDGCTWTSVTDGITLATVGEAIGETVTAIGYPSVVAYDPSSLTPELYIFYSVQATDASGNPTLYTCYNTYDGSSSNFGATQVAVSGQCATYPYGSTPAVVAPSPEGDALIYLFYTDYGSTVVGGYSLCTGPVLFYQATGNTGDILYSVTADGNTWESGQITYSEDTQVLPARLPTWGSPYAFIRDETLLVTLPWHWY